MKRLRWRLFRHFSVQFISIAILMAFLILLILIVVVGSTTKSEAQNNYYQAKVESISIETGFSLSKIKLTKGWDKDLAKDNIWVQLIREDGKVIDSGNVPQEIPTEYRPIDLLNMQQTNELQGYSLTFYFETFYETPYLFVLGYKDSARTMLSQLVQGYGQNGLIANVNQQEIEEKLRAVQGSLDLFDANGTLQQTFGNGTEREEEQPLDAFKRSIAPDIFSMKKTTFKDPESNILWVLYTPNNHKNEIQLDSLKDVLIALGITGAIILLLTLLLAIWNGFRYGNPLFIFTNWLSRMGNGQYDEVLTERERKQVFRKNGKTKLKYRLYEEVFHAFYDMAEKLDASRKERERLEQTREEWMAGISHDLRTPITTMAGYGNLLESGQYDWTTEELEDIGKTIREKSDYMVRLIEDFSLSFQLKNDAVKVIFQRTEVNQLLGKIVGKFTGDITLADYPISYQPLAYQQYLFVDERWFERMMDNLIYNAIKHNPPGTKIKISVAPLSEGKELKFIIKDNGIGMDEETKKHLFNRYYRGTNTDEVIEGTGLGMGIALQIAKLHKGRIQVNSTENLGTEIIITIPVCE